MIEQRTDEWYAAKLGKLGASNMCAAMAIKKDGGDYAERANLKMQILAERLTGKQVEVYITKDMQWGIDNEPVAKSMLIDLGIDIQDVGFIDHPTIKDFGASPDGFSADGLIEIKCPKSETHLKWMLSGVIPEENKPQMLAQMACTGRKWCDFVSFDPRMINPEFRLFALRFMPSPEEISQVELAAIRFLEELETMIVRLEKCYL